MFVRESLKIILLQQEVEQRCYPFRGRLLYTYQFLDRGPGRYSLINNIFWNRMIGIMYKAGCRIYCQGSPYNHKNIRFLNQGYGRLHHGHRFSKPDDMGAELSPIRSQIPIFYIFLCFIYQGRVSGTAHLENFPMKMQYPGRASTLMEIIYILCNDSHLKMPFKFGQTLVGR